MIKKLKKAVNDLKEFNANANPPPVAAGGASAPPPSGRPADAPPIAMGMSADTVLKFKADLYEHGRGGAGNGDTRVDEKRLAALEDHAEAMARDQATALFNPAESEHDKIEQEKYERAKARLGEIQPEKVAAEQDVRKREDAVADLGEPVVKPAHPWTLIAVGATVIGLTVSPTAHDFFFADTLEDSRAGWVFSIVGGALVGALISWCLLGTFENTAANRVKQRVGLIGGILFGVALLLIRLVAVESRTSLILAVGLAILEVAIVVLLDWIGKGLRHKYAEWEQWQKERTRRVMLLDAARRELAYRTGQEGEQQEVMDKHLAHVGERESRALQIPNLIRSARQTVRDGYLAGIAENQGRLRGPAIG